jgi:hypothetical protein
MSSKFLPMLVMLAMLGCITDAYAPTNSFVTLRPTKHSAVVAMRAQMGRFAKTIHTTHSHTGMYTFLYASFV